MPKASVRITAAIQHTRSFFLFDVQGKLLEVHPLVQQLIICPNVLDHSILEHCDPPGFWQELLLVRHKDTSRVVDIAADTALKEMGTNMSIHCREWVVKQVDICLRVHSPGFKCHSKSISSEVKRLKDVLARHTRAVG